MEKKKIDMESFKEMLAEQLRAGKPLTGSGGVFTPLLKEVLEKAMEAEIDAHVSKTRKSSGNRRNGHSRKTVKSSLGAFDLSTPRDRNSTYEPEMVGKRQVFISDDIAEPVDVELRFRVLASNGAKPHHARARWLRAAGHRASDQWCQRPGAGPIGDFVAPRSGDWVLRSGQLSPFSAR